MSVRIRFAEPAQDAPRILAVYAPYVERTAVTFETDVPDLAEFTARVAGIAKDFPYLLLEIDGELAGYAYAHRQAERAAYQWNAELSIYLAEGFVHRGLGAPLSGCFNNFFTDCMGSPIRSEIWAVICAGMPELAAYYAYQDASVDHAGGEGVYGEIFFAVLESMAFTEQDKLTLIHSALSYLPEDCAVR